jgi:hypothetical protein
MLGKSEHGYITVCVMQNKHDESYEANARLIAAAPELLEACKAALAFMYNGRSHTASEIIAIGKTLEAAIAKAERTVR